MTGRSGYDASEKNKDLLLTQEFSARILGGKIVLQPLLMKKTIARPSTRPIHAKGRWFAEAFCQWPKPTRSEQSLPWRWTCGWSSPSLCWSSYSPLQGNAVGVLRERCGVPRKSHVYNLHDMWHVFKVCGLSSQMLIKSLMTWWFFKEAIPVFRTSLTPLCSCCCWNVGGVRILWLIWQVTTRWLWTQFRTKDKKLFVGSRY